MVATMEGNLIADSLENLQSTEQNLWHVLGLCQQAQIALGGEPVHTITGKGSPMNAITPPTPPDAAAARSRGANGAAVSYEAAVNAFQGMTDGTNQTQFASQLGVSRATAKRYLEQLVTNGVAIVTGKGTQKIWRPIAVVTS